MASGLEISNQIEKLLRLREESGIENVDFIDYDSMLEIAEKSFSEKLTAYTYALKNMRMASALLSERAETLRDKARTLDKEERNLKEYIKNILENSPNVVAISSEKDRFTLCDNQESLHVNMALSSRSISKVIDWNDNGTIPPEFIDIVSLRCLNTDKVKQYLKDGGKLEWAELKRGKHVRIS